MSHVRADLVSEFPDDFGALTVSGPTPEYALDSRIRPRLPNTPSPPHWASRLVRFGTLLDESASHRLRRYHLEMLTQAVKVTAISRAVVGLAFLVAPKFLLELTGEDWVNAASTMSMRARGIRDIALGAGAIVSSRSDCVLDVRRWLFAGLACDAADAAAAVVSFRSIASPEPAAITATAVGFVALDRWALRSTYSDRENEVRT